MVDADHYVAPVWQGSIRDADKIIGSFSKFCHMAGEKCALYRPHDKASDVEAKFQGVFTKLEKNPITLIDQYSRTPVIVTINDIRSFLFVTLYSPQQLFPLVAILADYLMREDYTLLGGMSAIPPLQLFCGSILPPYVYPNEAPPAIMCSDKRYPVRPVHLLGIAESNCRDSSTKLSQISRKCSRTWQIHLLLRMSG